MTTIMAAVAPAASASKAAYVFMSSNRRISAQGEGPHDPVCLWPSSRSSFLRSGATHHDPATALSCCARSKAVDWPGVRAPRRSGHQDRCVLAMAIFRTLQVPMLPAWSVVGDDGRERNQSLVLAAK
jgi:hypothetical protein